MVALLLRQLAGAHAPDQHVLRLVPFKSGYAAMAVMTLGVNELRIPPSGTSTNKEGSKPTAKPISETVSITIHVNHKPSRALKFTVVGPKINKEND